MRTLTVRREMWPLARSFTISRGTKTAAEVVLVEIADGDAIGRGECLPYPRYGESAEGVADALTALGGEVADGLDRAALQQRLPAGAARNALDCALWDLEAKLSGQRVWQLAGLPAPRPVPTAETIGLDSPAAMAAAAAGLRARPLLKLKLDSEDIIERIGAVRAAAPQARLVVDANESWDITLLQRVGGMLAALAVELIEQPLPAAADAALQGVVPDVMLCADESCHTAADVDRLPEAYGMVNVKLDKAGGLTEALRVLEAARARGRKVMVGCMVATSLGIAPAMLLAAHADVVDLDGPLWLAHDRGDPLRFSEGFVYPPEPALWG